MEWYLRNTCIQMFFFLHNTFIYLQGLKESWETYQKFLTCTKHIRFRKLNARNGIKAYDYVCDSYFKNIRDYTIRGKVSMKNYYLTTYKMPGVQFCLYILLSHLQLLGITVSKSHDFPLWYVFLVYMLDLFL